jgi:hypothetical protein
MGRVFPYKIFIDLKILKKIFLKFFKNNISVEKLHLDGNWIEHNGAKYLSRMIRQNDFITELVGI